MNRNLYNIGGEPDINDLQYVEKRFGMPIATIPAPRKGRKINPQCSRFIYADGRMVDVLHVKPIYYATPQGHWRPLYEVASYYGNKGGMVLRGDWESRVNFGYLVWYLKRQELLKGKGIRLEYFLGKGLDTLKVPLLLNVVTTVFPDPNPETTTVDGYVGRDTADTWSNIRSGAGQTASDSISRLELWTKGHTVTDQWTNLYRVITLFDTSAIGDTDTIDSATLSFYLESGITNPNAFSLSSAIITTAPASNTALVASDYANVTFTRQATDIAFGSWTTAPAYTDHTLNSTGLGNVSKTGVTKFGMVMDDDVDNTTPPGWVSGTVSGCANNNQLMGADTTGTSEDPKLAVTHTAAATVTSTPTMLLMGIGL